tara:strand:- start:8665 stop:9645 length:981 start_codon:yes stop_codon:yes gene_type:complete
MGLFSSIKKAFKKVVGGIKKVVKKVVGGVKKVVKKIGSSKILKALAIAAAVVVTGGAAIGAFGGKLATTKFGSWMVGASQKVLGGTLFGTVKAGQPLLNVLKQTGNFASKMIAKPFGAAGKAVGSVAGGATDLLGITDKASRMGYVLDPTTGKYVIDTSKTFQSAGPTGYFTDDLSGQTLAEVKAGKLGTIGIGKVVDPVTGNVVAGSVSSAGVVTPSTAAQGPTTGQIMKSAAINQGFNLASAAVTSKYFSEDPRGESDSLYLEGKTPLTPLQVWASESNIDIASAYNNPTYGTGDPNYMMNAALYSQDTIGTPTNLPITGEMYG